MLEDIPVLKVKKRNVTYISTNLYYSGMHWTARNKIKDAWHKLVADATKAYDIQPYSVPVQLYFEWSNRFDLDNNAVMRKMIIDGLVQARIIIDDTKKFVKGIKERIGTNKGILVEITDYTGD